MYICPTVLQFHITIVIDTLINCLVIDTHILLIMLDTVKYFVSNDLIYYVPTRNVNYSILQIRPRERPYFLLKVIELATGIARISPHHSSSRIDSLNEITILHV